MGRHRRRKRSTFRRHDRNGASSLYRPRRPSMRAKPWQRDPLYLKHFGSRPA